MSGHKSAAAICISQPQAARAIVPQKLRGCEGWWVVRLMARDAACSARTMALIFGILSERSLLERLYDAKSIADGASGVFSSLQEYNE